TGVNTNDTWQLASRAIGLAAAFAILLAYHPPPFVRQRLGVRSITDDAGTTESLRAPEAPRGSAIPAAAC
ncbi:MAG: hypothetical protein L0Y66_26235, partial [Myxococcaceae bacterium]|nr:hypothetical protein [Myxococcaceae bacterium]